MGFSYKDWKGVFYPADMQERRYLVYYSRVFKSVEIDSTFYGTPNANSVRRWAAVTPQDFRFCLKVPRQITHEARLVGARDEFNRFVDTAALLGDKLGVILFQFPPSFGASRLSVLGDFLSDLPKGVRFAVEIRAQSWYTAKDETGDLALARVLEQFGVCWAATEYPGLPGRIHLTSDFLYLRWIGQHGTYSDHDHERIDLSENLHAWWQHIQVFLGRVDTLYGYFNNDYAGFAAGTANRFKRIAGLPFKTLKPPQQGTLF